MSDFLSVSVNGLYVLYSDREKIYTLIVLLGWTAQIYALRSGNEIVCACVSENVFLPQQKTCLYDRKATGCQEKRAYHFPISRYTIPFEDGTHVY